MSGSWDVFFSRCFRCVMTISKDHQEDLEKVCVSVSVSSFLSVCMSAFLSVSLSLFLRICARLSVFVKVVKMQRWIQGAQIDTKKLREPQINSVRCKEIMRGSQNSLTLRE